MKLTKKLISIIICVLLLMSSLPLYAVAYDGTPKSAFEGGDGTAENPYKVSTPEQLDAVRMNMAAHYIQVNDIDMKDWGSWTPIGHYIYNSDPASGSFFDGTYNGNGYKISNLRIDDDSITSKTDSYGLFATLGDGKILNLNLDRIDYKMNKTGAVEIGGIVGFAGEADSRISNCVVSGNIVVNAFGSATVGGITGAGGTITGCINKADIYVVSSGTSYCGGVSGASARIDCSVNYGEINVEGRNILNCGGIMGYGYSITRCVNYGAVECLNANATSRQNPGRNTHVGGIVGKNYDPLKYCVNFADVSSISMFDELGYFGYDIVRSYVGGISGYNFDGFNGYGDWGSEMHYNINFGKNINSYRESIDNNGTLVPSDSGRIAGYLPSSSNNTECYSVDYTLLNGSVPTLGVSTREVNGSTILEKEAFALMDDWGMPVLTGDNIVVSKIDLGIDSYSFGEDITGCVGDEIDALVLYTTVGESIRSLKFTSSKTSVVSISTIDIGVGDYTPSENEHMATIALKLKAEGSSTITITSPEGVSTSIIVTVVKATEPEPFIEESIKYGLDSSSFGQDITGYEGGEQDTLLVYTSTKHDIDSLEITSSNTNIVEIGKVTKGTRDSYQSNKYDHVATVPLKLKSEGTATITITSPEDVRVSVNVTVTIQDPIMNFDVNMYIADMWMGENDHIMSDSFADSIEIIKSPNMDPSRTVVKELETDDGFLASAAGWEIANIINDPSKTYDGISNRQQYYESILLSLISSNLKEGNFLDYLERTKVVQTSKFTKSFAKFVNSIEGMEKYDILTQKLTPAEKSMIKNDLKNLKSAEFLEIFDSVDILIDIYEYSNDISDFINVCVQYAMLNEINEYVVSMLDTMYMMCDSSTLSLVDRTHLKTALATVKGACNDQLGKLLLGISNGTSQVLKWDLDALCGLAWTAICKSNVYALCLKSGLSVGIGLSNLAFSTDKTLAQYYSMTCLNNVREVINLSSDHLAKQYKDNKTPENAKAYISSVGFIFDSYLLSINNTMDLYKTVYEDALYGKIMYKDDEEYISLKKSAESLANQVRTEYYIYLQKQWCFGLLEDYPQLFDEMAKSVDLFFYLNVENANVRVQNISWEYTGKAITPEVSVVLCSSKLELNSDYTVEYSNNTEPGIATVKITGIGDYHGTKTVQFAINKPWYGKKIDIRNNGYVSDFNLAPVGSLYEVSSKNTEKASISIYVYDGDEEIAVIENGEIVKSDIHAYIIGDKITLLLPNDDYRLIVTADQNTSVDYSYSEYNNQIERLSLVNYNDVIVNKEDVISQDLSDGIVTLGEKALMPNYYDSENNQKYSISVDGGAASTVEASENEWVHIVAVVPEEYSFVEWQTTANIDLLDNYSASTSFVMCDSDVDLIAVFEKYSDLPTTDPTEPEITEPSTGEEDEPADSTEPSTGEGDKPTDSKPTEPSTSGETNTTDPTEPSTGGQDKPTDPTEPSTGGQDKPTDPTEPSTGGQDKPTDLTDPIVIGLLGDVNGDGKVNIKDATQIQKYAAKLIELTDEEKLRADVNADEKINVKDATVIQKYAAKFETGFLIGEPVKKQ